MLPAIFWLIIGFVVGVLFNERLVKQRQGPAERPSSRFNPPPAPTSPPAEDHIKFEAAEPPPPPPVAHPPAAPESSGDAASGEEDDLTVIKGIGATFSQRLKDAGITTFSRLAAAEPGQLREITRIRDWQKPAPEDWIDEAQSLK